MARNKNQIKGILILLLATALIMLSQMTEIDDRVIDYIEDGLLASQKVSHSDSNQVDIKSRYSHAEKLLTKN